MVNSEEKTIIDIDTESFRLEVREWNSLTRGFINIIAEWLNREITKKEEEAKKPLVEEEKIEEEPSKKVTTEKTPSNELQKTIPKFPCGSGTRVMSEDHALKRYDNGVVWDVVLDYIYANVPDEFKKDDVIGPVFKYYKTELKRPITPLTAKNYAGMYIKYMRNEDTPYRIEQCNDPSVSPEVLYKRVRPEKALEEEAGREKPSVSSAVMSSKHRLKKYGTTSVYKPVLDFILERAPDPFTSCDVSSLIEKYYRKVLSRTLKESTQDLYADRYIRYMLDFDPPIVERYADPSVSPLLLCRRIKHVDEPAEIKHAEEPVEIEKEEGSDVADDIYDLAKKEGWTDRKKQVSIAFIKEHLPKYSIDEIFSGVTCLIKKHMVAQMPSDEVMF